MSNDSLNPQQSSADLVRYISQMFPQKGGFDASSKFSDAFGALLAGVYQPKRTKEVNEYFEQYAPDLGRVWGGAPDGGFESDVAFGILGGGTAYSIKQKSRKKFPDIFDNDDASDYIDAMAGQYAAANKAKYDDDNEEDEFQKVGLPSAKQDYTAADIEKMDPEYFNSARASMGAAQEQSAAMMERFLASNPNLSKPATFVPSVSSDTRSDYEKRTQGSRSKARDKTKPQAPGAPAVLDESSRQQQNYLGMVRSYIDRVPGGEAEVRRDVDAREGEIREQLRAGGRNPTIDAIFKMAGTRAQSSGSSSGASRKKPAAKHGIAEAEAAARIMLGQ